MELHNAWKEAKEVIDFCNKVDIFQLDNDQEIALGMTINKATQVKNLSERLQMIMSEMRGWYDQLINTPIKKEKTDL